MVDWTVAGRWRGARTAFATAPPGWAREGRAALSSSRSVLLRLGIGAASTLGWLAPGAAAAAPAIDPGHKYHISLASDAERTPPDFTAARMNPAAGFGGFVALQAGRAGAYRVSLDERAWIELIAEPSGRAAVVTTPTSACAAPASSRT
ncbi:MAG: hypothetical protein M0C28_32515 [Candidatus Moduliflexus flocculans]|nr:hypothetical protein [Candidatus Moduliflexus flocculans]